MRFLLEAYDFDVRTYLSGAEFLRDGPEIACLIIDYQMRDRNGFDVISELRSRNSRVPVIVITATDNPTVERRATEHGIQQVLQKPLSGRVLLGAIRKELE